MKELVPLLLGLLGAILPDLDVREGRVARFTARLRVARAFKTHFGDALALARKDLQRVEIPGAPSDRFVAFSDQRADAARRLTPACLDAVRQVWSTWPDIGVRHAWIGLCGDRVAIACTPDRQADVGHVAALVEAGSMLTRVDR